MKLGFTERILIGSLLLVVLLLIILVKTNQQPLDVNNKLKLIPSLNVEQGKIKYQLSSHKGQWFFSEDNKNTVVIFYFWATWCKPSKTVLNILNDLWLKNDSNKLKLVTVSLDSYSELVVKFMQEKKFEFPCLTIPTKILSEFKELEGIPTLYLISPSGEIVAKYEGLISAKKIDRVVKKLLAQTNHS